MKSPSSPFQGDLHLIAQRGVVFLTIYLTLSFSVSRVLQLFFTQEE